MEPLKTYWENADNIVKVIVIVIILYLVPGAFYKSILIVVLTIFTMIKYKIDEALFKVMNIEIENTKFADWKINGNSVIKKYQDYVSKAIPEVTENDND